MSSYNKLLLEINHRPYALPQHKWVYYQEWNDVLFLHYKVPYEILKELIPTQLVLDTFDGDAFVSIVPFTMQKIRPRQLPAVSAISDFHEINARTYVSRDDKQGVYFLNIEAQKVISALIARALSSLPYEKAKITRGTGFYRSINKAKNFQLDTEFRVGAPLIEKTALDIWLTERYCLYLKQADEIYRYDIHHQEWNVQEVRIKKLTLQYAFGSLDLSNETPFLAHYSKGVEVLAWSKTKLEKQNTT